uniref:Glutathione S-transferase n=1 Tax=Panagrolaimus sp. ES5 TaxID=591445 RepID=A0AC34G0G7_9BILA
MSDKFELVSLAGRGRAELIRMLLIASDTSFIDHRITLKQWTEYRRKEFLPDDTKLPLLRINGFYGKTKSEEQEIEKIISDIEYLHQNLTPVIRAALSKNFLQKKEAWNEYKERSLQPILERLTARLENKTFFVGNKISLADFAVAEILSRFISCFESNFIHSYQILKSHMASIERLPSLQRYVSDRPSSSY